MPLAIDAIRQILIIFADFRAAGADFAMPCHPTLFDAIADFAMPP
jgi:hypothetical protein